MAQCLRRGVGGRLVAVSAGGVHGRRARLRCHAPMLGPLERMTRGLGRHSSGHPATNRR